MGVNTNDGERYVPTLFGNDKKDVPLVFNLQFLSVKDQDEIEYYESVSVKGKDRITIKVNHYDVFRRGVASIEGCGAFGKDVMNPDEFLAIRGKASKELSQYMQDVAMRIKNAAEIDEKNLPPPSVSGPGDSLAPTGA
jgi:hypothetical protein